MTGLLCDDLFLEHGHLSHPENRTRLEAAVAHLQATGHWEAVTHLAPRAATLEELLWQHDEDYIEEIEAVSRAGGDLLDHDTEATARTYEVAAAAAGGCIAVTEAVLLGGVPNAYCLVRPPGHHALRHRAMGFCVFNNVALAAEAALRRGHRDQVAIVDFDLHHGNGTQDAFYHRGDVLYISLHQSPLFPGTGTVDEVGVAEGAGTTVNIPLPGGAEDRHYLRAFEELVIPLLAQFEPEMIFVSAGFDTHFRERIYLSEMCLSARCYYEMTRQLVEVADERCGGRAVVVLEGGYDAEAMGRGSEAVLRALLGEDPPEPEELDYRIHPEATEWVDQCLQYAIETHRRRLRL